MNGHPMELQKVAVHTCREVHFFSTDKPLLKLENLGIECDHC